MAGSAAPVRGATDSGHFLAQAIAAAVPAGLAAALWAALAAGFAGLPWWSPLALYSTHMGGLSRTPVVAAGLAGAVVAGCVWLMLLALAVGALWGLLAGAAAPRPLQRRRHALLGLLFGLLLFGLASAAGASVLPPALVRDLPEWSRALTLGIMGAVVGGLAVEGPAYD